MRSDLLRRVLFSLLPASALFIAGCGQTYRPVATPIPQQGGPQPSLPAFALVLSNTGSATQGFLTSYNLPGDSNNGQIPVGHDPVYAMTPDGARGLVANRGEDSISFLFPISAPSTANLVTIALQPNSAPSYIASNGATAWVVNPGRNGKSPTLGVVSLSSNTEVTEVPVGANPVLAAFNSSSQKVYVVNQGSGSVTIVATTDNSVLASVPVGPSPSFAVVGTAGFVYVLNTGGSTVTQIDPNFDQVSNTINVCSQPDYAAYDAIARKIVIACRASNNVSILDADPASATYLRVVNVPVGTAPVSVAILGNSDRAAVANSGSNDVTIVDTLANRVLVPSIPVGTNPISVSAATSGTKLLVANLGSNTVTFIETNTYTVTSTLPAPPTVVSTFPTP